MEGAIGAIHPPRSSCDWRWSRWLQSQHVGHRPHGRRHGKFILGPPTPPKEQNTPQGISETNRSKNRSLGTILGKHLIGEGWG
eukprot:1739372-Amphidinium_carterae.1